MTHHGDLLRRNPDELREVLLRHARADRPTSAARQRALAGLASAAAGAGLLGGGSAAAAPFTAGLVAKWMVIGMGVGVACLGGVAEVRSLAESGGSAKAVATAIRPTNSSKARPSLPQRSNERPPQSPAPAARSAPRTSHPAVDSNPQNEVPAPASSPVGDLPAAAQSAQASRLARELVMLQSARSLLAAGAALQASQRLADYSREFPGGALRAEALALDVESAALLGNRARVADLEAAFIRDFPTSPLVGRVRALASAQR